MGFSSNLIYAVRLLKKKAGFSALCVLVLALGLSVSLVDYALATVFSSKTLPFPGGDKFTVLKIAGSDFPSLPVEFGWDSYQYNFLGENSSSFDTLGAIDFSVSGVISDETGSGIFMAAGISPELLNATGVVPFLGRSLLAADSLVGAQPVALISHNVWQNFFNGREDIVGKRSEIGGELRSIVGVMPEEFEFPRNQHLWFPLQLQTSLQPGEGPKLTLAAVLNDDASLDSASAELETLLQQINLEFPQEYQKYPSEVLPYVTMGNAGLETIVALMFAAMLVIVLLASINIGNLLLVRAIERSQELLIRSAVGASRFSLIRQILLESLLICIAGGLAGILIAAACLNLIDSVLPNLTRAEFLPFWVAFSLDTKLLSLAVSMILAIWLLSGFLPAWTASKIDLGEALKSSGKGVAGKVGGRAISALIMTELIVSVFLLIVSGMMVLAVNGLMQTDWGMEDEGLLSAYIQLPQSDSASNAENANYFRDLRNELMGQAGIREVAYSSMVIGQGLTLEPYQVEDQLAVANSVLPSEVTMSVDGNYFNTLSAPLLEGRVFNAGDSAESLPVAIVDEKFAEKVWPGESALGKRLQIDPDAESAWITVVGVSAHLVQAMPLGAQQNLTVIYRPLAQRTVSRVYMIAKVEGDPNGFQQLLREAAVSVDRNIPLGRAMPMTLIMQHNTGPLKAIGSIFVALSLVTLVLGGSGIYSIMSRSVILRTQEAGIRRALGASDLHSIFLFLKPGVKFLLLAIFFGGAAALLASSGLSLMFGQIAEFFPSVFVVVAVVVAFVVLGASYLPARKIVAMEPGEALHYE